VALKSLPHRLTTISGRRIAELPKVADAIYFDPRHHQWRDAVISRAGGACQWPACGRVEKRMFADHIHEIKDGGSRFDLANGQCLCGKHHTIKTNIERARRLGQ
jgi:5-methylcytosine-specific restriction enzyme A